MDFEKFKTRLPKLSEDRAREIYTVIERYNLKPTVRNFDNHGFRFVDGSKRTARVCSGSINEGAVQIQNPHADIAIIFADGLLSGWVDASKLEDLTDRFSVDIKALSPMPETFDFRQSCPHMSVFGGFYNGEFWKCANCKQRLVFNDKVNV